MRHRALPKSSLNLSHRYLTHSGDSVYGDDRALRLWLEQRQQAYVLAVSGKESVWLREEQRQIKTLLAEVSSQGWERLSAGAGRKGARLYDWRRLELSAPAQQGWKRLLLVRRSVSEPSELTGYMVFARAHTMLTELVRVAGTRWMVEESIQCAKGEEAWSTTKCARFRAGIATRPWRCGQAPF